MRRIFYLSTWKCSRRGAAARLILPTSLYLSTWKCSRRGAAARLILPTSLYFRSLSFFMVVINYKPLYIKLVEARSLWAGPSRARGLMNRSLDSCITH